MNIEPRFKFSPIEIRSDLTITESDFEQYLLAPGIKKSLEILVTEKFSKALIKDGKESYDFGFKITRKHMSKDIISWQPVFGKFKTYLEIRVDDSRVHDIEGIEYLEGLGYCINIELILGEIEKRIKENTTHSEYPQLYWPKRKKDEFIREIFIPDRNYSEINSENAKVCLNAKKFNSSIEDEVLSRYEKINQRWLHKETGYDRENIPPKEKSPIERSRKIAENKYIFIQLIREDKGNYAEVMTTIIADLNKIKNGKDSNLNKLYNASIQKGNLFLNIKKIKDRLDSLFKFNTDIRYTIVP